MSNVPSPPPPPPPGPPGGPPGPPPGGYGVPGPGPAPYPGQHPGQPAGGYANYGGAGNYAGGVAGRPYASFGARLGAYLLDGLLYGLVMIPFVLVGFALGSAQFTCWKSAFESNTYSCDLTGSRGLFALALVIGLVGLLVPVILYLNAMAKRGQTWGSKIVGLRVVTSTGEPPGWGKAIGRGLFATFISSNIAYIGYLWMLWDDNKQTLHDKVVDTYVVTD